MASCHVNKGAKFTGGAFIIVGLLFLLHNARIIDFSFIFSNFWPLLLIGIGVLIILNSKKNSISWNGDQFGDRSEYITDDYVDASHMFGDLKVSLENDKFKGGKLQTTFGELHVNLAKIQLDDGHNILHLNVTFGEIVVSVSPELPVRITAIVVAGDIKLFEQKWDGLNKKAVWSSESYESADSKIDIVCNLVFGDIKVW